MSDPTGTNRGPDGVTGRQAPTGSAAGGAPPGTPSSAYPVGAGTSGSPTPGAGGQAPTPHGTAGFASGATQGATHPSTVATTGAGAGGMRANPPIATPMSDLGVGGDTSAMSALLARNWWALVLRGILGILFGLVALFMPVAAMISLALLFSAYLLVDGVFAIVAAVRAAQAHQRWGLLLLEGVLNLAMGAIAFVFPGSAVLAFVLITAAWALITGGLMVAAAFRLNVAHGRWWLALGGIVSILWGLLLVMSPIIGALVLTWWLGGYAIAFGVMLLVLGFKLRAQHQSGASGPTLTASGAGSRL